MATPIDESQASCIVQMDTVFTTVFEVTVTERTKAVLCSSSEKKLLSSSSRTIFPSSSPSSNQL